MDYEALCILDVLEFKVSPSRNQETVDEEFKEQLVLYPGRELTHHYQNVVKKALSDLTASSVNLKNLGSWRGTTALSEIKSHKGSWNTRR